MRTKIIAVAAGAILASTAAASAADLPIPAPMPVPVDFGGWYLRGDIGMTNQSVKSIDSNSVPFISDQSGIGFDSSTLFAVGVGYQFNNWFRADITGQYRGKANLHGSQTIFNGTDHLADDYSGSKSEALFLANAYVDLGTWWGVTPFIGAGVGTSYNRISGFRDDGVVSNATTLFPSVTYFSDKGQWSFAWAAHAGIAYRVNPALTLEFAYSYVDLGDAAPGANRSFTGFPTPSTSIKFRDITSHDLTFGVRWAIDPVPAYVPGPLITKG
jgi:opacity protein-like surface antigen